MNCRRLEIGRSPRPCCGSSVFSALVDGRRQSFLADAEPWHARQFRPKVGSRNFDCVLTLTGSSRNKIPAIPLRALDRPALTACRGYAIGCDSAAQQPGAKNHVRHDQLIP